MEFSLNSTLSYKGKLTLTSTLHMVASSNKWLVYNVLPLVLINPGTGTQLRGRVDVEGTLSPPD